jgi:hypothetical protein
MADQLIEQRQLANGTTLSLYDASRRQAADRWIAVLEARIAIPLNEASFPGDRGDGLTLEAVRAVLGSQLVYVSRQERVFVPDEDKSDLIRRFRDDFCRHAEPYLSRPAFPSRYIVKQYHSQLKQQAWRRAAEQNPV